MVLLFCSDKLNVFDIGIDDLSNQELKKKRIIILLNLESLRKF